MNRYLNKIASDAAIAKQSLKEEAKAVIDYKDRLGEAKNPELKKVLIHARNEEKDHAKEFAEVLRKARG
jgi:hypothetical protein